MWPGAVHRAAREETPPSIFRELTSALPLPSRVTAFLLLQRCFNRFKLDLYQKLSFSAGSYLRWRLNMADAAVLLNLFALLKLSGLSRERLYLN